MPEERVTLEDCRTVQFCWTHGVVPFCEANGLSHRKLAREGLEFSELEPLEDAQVQKLLAAARKRIYG